VASQRRQGCPPPRQAEGTRHHRHCKRIMCPNSAV